ncbi:MAG: cell division protein SepF [Candidatus Diapherotrites archaeon]|nr:cell division protein SepF [Candidatus Diapherotrites archaeon]
MGFLDKVFTTQQESVDMEEVLNNLDVQEEVLYEDADAYVKPVALNDVDDVKMVDKELREGNLVLLNISDMSKRNAIKLRELISSIKGTVTAINGDIARISQDRVLITPARVKIVKRRME